MSHREENRGRGARPPAPTRPPSIASPAELAAHLGRDLSASAVDGDGWTDLHYAAALDWPGLARELLGDGAPVSARLRTDGGPLGRELRGTLRGCGREGFGDLGRVGLTALHVAVIGAADEIVTMLLEGGADPETTDASCRTPLHYSAALDLTPPAVTLVRAGAGVDRADILGQTPLHWAATTDGAENRTRPFRAWTGSKSSPAARRVSLRRARFPASASWRCLMIRQPPWLNGGACPDRNPPNGRARRRRSGSAPKRRFHSAPGRR